MPAQKGKDLLLKIDNGGSFATVAGLRTRTLAFNAETVDVTNQDSVEGWRELLSGTGIKSARVAGAGIFKDAPSDELVRAAFFDGAIPDFEMTIPDFGKIEGPFQITSFELTGRHDGEVGFDIALESAGALSFTAL